MSVRRKVEVEAFNGRRVFKNSGNVRVISVASGTGTADKVGVITYDVSGEGVYIAIDTSGTGTQINA